MFAGVVATPQLQKWLVHFACFLHADINQRKEEIEIPILYARV